MPNVKPQQSKKYRDSFENYIQLRSQSLVAEKEKESEQKCAKNADNKSEVGWCCRVVESLDTRNSASGPR